MSLTARPTRGIALARPTARFTARSSSILNNAQNNNINNNTFVTNIKAESSLDAFYSRVAPNAIHHNAGGSADVLEVGCHPGTRIEVIGHVEKWRDGQGGLTEPILWLSGPAGAGKTAIMQTIVERCNEQGVPQINFFFSGTDTSRNSLFPLVATLPHQIILLYPLVGEAVAAVLSANPLIFDAAPKEQLAQLIVAPLCSIQQSSASYRPPILLIDGLDECESDSRRGQREMLHALDQVLTEHPHSCRLLVASRDVPQIRAAFSRISSPSHSLILDDKYSPESDIRLFVNDRFKRVRKMHPLAKTLDATWPSVKDIHDIVKKSSGQFIYAATVMRFILDSSASPMLSLEMVQGSTSNLTKSPFSDLDALYTQILSRATNQEALKVILYVQFLIQELRRTLCCDTTSCGKIHLRSTCILLTERPMDLLEVLKFADSKYTKAIVYSCLADLTPLVCYDVEMLFYHASFSDYILDHSRSGDYFVNIGAVFTTVNLLKLQARLRLAAKRGSFDFDDITVIRAAAKLLY